MAIKQASKADELRSILTEVLPFDLPFIISNDNFYLKLSTKSSATHVDEFIERFIKQSDSFENKVTIPLTYRIKKNLNEMRELKLIHPFHQLSSAKFLENYNHLICYYCSRSDFSIRAPSDVAPSCYLENPKSNNLIKENRVSTNKDKFENKYLRSYFSYSGYDRLFKFYNSVEFIDLEKRFSRMWRLDISSFFDSIYTHTIPWVIKDKDFVKQNINKTGGCIGSDFDLLMQKSNYNETNGLPIGNEVSRIFAEILLQRKDSDLQACLLERHKLIHGKHYSIRRYVDDYFVFTNDEDTAELIKLELASFLKDINLNLNSNKMVKMTRPFLSDKSRLMWDCNKKLDDFFSSILSHRKLKIGEEEFDFIFPLPVERKTFSQLINDMKAACFDSGLGVQEASGFVIGAMLKRTERLCLQQVDVLPKDAKLEISGNLLDSLLILARVSFYFYQISPTVSSSINLGKIVSLILKAANSEAHFKETVSQEIFDLGLDYLNNSMGTSSIKMHEIEIEVLNVVIMLSQVSESLNLPRYVLDRFRKEKLSYLEIVSILFYIKNYAVYSEIKDHIVVILNKKLSELTLAKSEDFYLAMDMISCPYLDKPLRLNFLEKVSEFLGFQFRHRNFDELLDEFSKGWFVTWEPVSFYNMLERKMLKTMY